MTFHHTFYPQRLALRLFIAAAAICLPIAHAFAGEYLVICSGQSNMGGVAVVADMPDEVRGVPGNVVYYHSPDAKNLQPAKSFDDGKKFGPVPRFAHVLAAARPDDRFIILHDAVGGSALAQWVTNYEPNDIAKRFRVGELYQAMLPRLAAVHKAHPKAKPLAFLWLQGESDAGPYAAPYGDNLKKLVASVRRDCGNPSMLALIAEPRQADAGVYDGIHKFVKDDKFAALIESKEIGRPGLHFNAKGYDEIGRLFADSLAKLMIEKEKAAPKK
ncbi:hypothetical protein BH10PLA1_BH10PLA1_02790 [soil metagenome]